MPLSSLFGSRVATAWLELCTESPELLPEEAALAEGASPQRRAELAGGRACARRALAQLGVPVVAIGKGTAGEPEWPPGVVGAISHAAGVCCAAVALASDMLGVGVDVEEDAPDTPAFARRVCSERELAALAALGESAERASRVVFSVKETLVKLQFPLTGTTLGLRHSEVLLSRGSFIATFLAGSAPQVCGRTVRGRWQRSLGLVWTGAWLPVE
jgi:4'-phosphopantetheinyl transferase EntD